MLKVPTEAEAFAEFSRYVIQKRTEAGFVPPPDEVELRRWWDILSAFQLAWDRAPSSATPSAPRGGEGSGAGSEGV